MINYVLLGFQFPVDGYFMHSFEIWLATTVVFWGSGTVGYTLLEYRLGKKSLVSCLPLLLHLERCFSVIFGRERFCGASVVVIPLWEGIVLDVG